MNIKQRVEKLEQVKNPDSYLVHYLPRIAGEDYAVTQESYCLEYGLKKNEIVFADDVDMKL